MVDERELLEQITLIQKLLLLVVLNPWVRQTLLDTDSLGWILHQHLLDEIDDLRIDILPLLFRKINFFVQNLLYNLVIGISPKRRKAASNHVENDSTTPDVCPSIVLFLQHLWSDVENSPHWNLEDLSFFVVGGLGEVD